MINIYDFICSNSSSFTQLKFGNGKKILIDYLCPITENQARAWSHKNCLMYVVQGVKGYSSLNTYHRSQKNQLLFIRKGGVVLHQQFEEPYRALIFMFDDAAIKDFVAEFPTLTLINSKGKIDFQNYPTVAPLQSSKFIESIFMSSNDYLQNPTTESRIVLEIKFKELMINILREKSSNSFNLYLAQLCNENSTTFIKLMRENGHYNFTTEELARIACMSLSTFKRVFKKHFGISPGRWLRKQRISRAQTLLINGNTIADVAFELGYNDTAAFSKAFKLSTSRSPSDFMKMA